MTVGNRNGLLLPNTTTDQGEHPGRGGPAPCGRPRCSRPACADAGLTQVHQAATSFGRWLASCVCILELALAAPTPRALRSSPPYTSVCCIACCPSPAELMHIRNSLPDEVVVQRIDERLSALGNCIACNDYVALIHPDIDRVSAACRAWEEAGRGRGRKAHAATMRCSRQAPPGRHARLWRSMWCSRLSAQPAVQGFGRTVAVHARCGRRLLRRAGVLTPPCRLAARRRRRRLWRMCWAWRCSGRALRATCWWGPTASSPTRGAWWHRRWADAQGGQHQRGHASGRVGGGAAVKRRQPLRLTPVSSACMAGARCAALVCPPVAPSHLDLTCPAFSLACDPHPCRPRWRTWTSCPACCRCRWWRAPSTAAAMSSAQVGGPARCGAQAQTLGLR